LYKAAEQEINKGLSPFARFILGFFSGLFGMVMVLIAPPASKAILFYAFGGFCLLICLATLTKGKVRQFIGSVIGCVLFVLSGWYMFSQITTGPIISGSRSEPSVINSVFFFIAFGIPGISYTIKTKFGRSKNENENKP